MKLLLFVATVLALLAPCREAVALGEDWGASVFGCQVEGDKFITLNSTRSASGEIDSLQYRFGSRNAEGKHEVELVFPEDRAGSLKQFFGATYTHEGIYTQTVRFVSGGFSYTVFTRTIGYDPETGVELEAGVEVRNQRTGKTVVVDCHERPRFYISELKDVLACDPATPVGTACIE